MPDQLSVRMYRDQVRGHRDNLNRALDDATSAVGRVNAGADGHPETTLITSDLRRAITSLTEAYAEAKALEALHDVRFLVDGQAT